MCVWKSYVFAHHLNVLCVVISITAASILQAPRNTVIFRTYLKTSAPACGHTVGVFSRNGPVRCKPTQIINNISFFLLRCVCGAHKQFPLDCAFIHKHLTEVCSPAEGSTNSVFWQEDRTLSAPPLRGKTRCTWGLLNPFVLKRLRQYKRKWSRKTPSVKPELYIVIK